MKRGVVIILIILLFGCANNKTSLELEVESTVQEYFNGMMDHWYSEDYDEVVKDVFHPFEVNPLGVHLNYNSITDDLKMYPGINIVTSARIDSMFVSNEKVYDEQRIDSGDKSYFVKVVYNVVAFQDGNKMVVLEEPIKVYNYLILAIDEISGKYKILDVSPSPSARFLKLSYALEKIDHIARKFPGIDYEKLKLDLLRIKK